VTVDELLLRALYASGSPAVTYAMLGFTALGSGWTATGALPFLLHTKARRYVFEVAAIILTASLLVFVLKLSIGRPRPCYALSGIRALYIVTAPPRDFSCPSGHAAGAFAVATYVALRFRQKLGTWTRGMLFALAGLIAISRIYLGVHFPSDVALGATLGCATAAALTRWMVRIRVD
jgi:undecaprenyl-diphosphatase